MTPAMSVVATEWMRSGANDNQSRTPGRSNRSGSACAAAGDLSSLVPDKPAVSPAITRPATLPPEASRHTAASSDNGTESASGCGLNRRSLEKPPSHVSPVASRARGAAGPSPTR